MILQSSNLSGSTSARITRIAIFCLSHPWNPASTSLVTVGTKTLIAILRRIGFGGRYYEQLASVLSEVQQLSPFGLAIISTFWAKSSLIKSCVCTGDLTQRSLAGYIGLRD